MPDHLSRTQMHAHTSTHVITPIFSPEEVSLVVIKIKQKQYLHGEAGRLITEEI